MVRVGSLIKFIKDLDIWWHQFDLTTATLHPLADFQTSFNRRVWGSLSWDLEQEDVSFFASSFPFLSLVLGVFSLGRCLLFLNSSNLVGGIDLTLSWFLIIKQAGWVVGFDLALFFMPWLFSLFRGREKTGKEGRVGTDLTRDPGSLIWKRQGRRKLGHTMREQVVWERWEESLGRFIKDWGREGREGEKRDAEIQFLVSWETGLLNFLLSGAHGEDLTMVCVWLRVLTSNAKDKGIEKDQSCSTIHKMSVWVDKEITSWSKMGGNSTAAPPSARKWGCEGISEELFMFWTRKLEWILAGIWIPCQLDRVNPKLGFKCVLDSW